jgi:ATP-dependent helicase/nuclease subunit A
MGLGLSCVDEENRVRYPTVSKSAIAAKMAADSISEEMRVLYVAMTRPKDRLIMTYASDSLDKDISSIALRMDICSREAMTMDVNCPGKWVLYSALHRTEAGEFFALGHKPGCTAVHTNPWLIRVVNGEVPTDELETHANVDEISISQETVSQIAQGLGFRYPHLCATVTPSKQTATQRKGRLKDQEAAENTSEPRLHKRVWRKPSFMEAKRDPTAYGTAVHSLLQHISYDQCDTQEESKILLLSWCSVEHLPWSMGSFWMYPAFLPFSKRRSVKNSHMRSRYCENSSSPFWTMLPNTAKGWKGRRYFFRAL